MQQVSSSPHASPSATQAAPQVPSVQVPLQQSLSAEHCPPSATHAAAQVPSLQLKPSQQSESAEQLPPDSVQAGMQAVSRPAMSQSPFISPAVQQMRLPSLLHCEFEVQSHANVGLVGSEQKQTPVLLQ